MCSSFKLLTTSILSGSVLVAGLLSAQPAAAVELLINNYLPAKHPFQVAVQAPWAKDVAKATNGAVVPKFSTAGVGPAPKNWQTVSKGVADVVLLANIFQRKRIQLPGVSEFPLSSPSAEKTSKALWRAHEKYFAKANEYKGNHLVASFVLTPNIIHSRNKPIRTVADLKGYKIRTASGITTNIVKTLGGVPVAVGPFKIFSVMSKGVVDGVAVPSHGLFAFRIMPYTKFTTLIPGGLSNTSFSLLVNGKKWDGLTKAQQAQVMSVSGMAISNRAGKIDKIAAGALAALKKKGGKVIAPDPSFVEALRKLAAAAEVDWVKNANAKGVEGKAALAFFKEQLM